MSLERLSLFEAIIFSTFLYEAELWPLCRAKLKRPKSTHHKWQRKTLKIHWNDMIANVEIRRWTGQWTMEEVQAVQLQIDREFRLPQKEILKIKDLKALEFFGILVKRTLSSIITHILCVFVSDLTSYYSHFNEAYSVS